MVLGMKMSMRLSQQLRMTPQLQQAIKLLQLSRMELETEVRKELTENPILEEVQETSDDDPAAKSQMAEDLKTAEAEVTTDNDPRKQEEFEWEHYVESVYKPPQQSMGDNNDEIMNYENLISTTQTLTDYLM